MYERTTAGDYVYPVWADVLGWMITLSCVLWIPGLAVYHMTKTRDWKKLLRPTADWGSAAYRKSLGYTADGKLSESSEHIFSLLPCACCFRCTEVKDEQ